MPVEIDGVTVYFTGEPDSPIKSVTVGTVSLDEIRKTYNKDNLYEDPDFPANIKSVEAVDGDAAAGKDGKEGSDYKWLRPHELCKSVGIEKVTFADIQDDSCGNEVCSEFDVRQGALADCGSLAAIGELAKRPDLLKFVIPQDNFKGYDDDKYCGAFHFRFCRKDGAEKKWVDIVVDDLLPSKSNGAFMEPVFAKITGKRGDGTVNKVAEFWVALLEKALAKFKGSFKKLEGFNPGQILEILTGGVLVNIEDLRQYNESFKYDELVETLKGAGVGKLGGYTKNGDFIGLITPGPDLADKMGVLNGYSCFYSVYDENKKLIRKPFGFKRNPANNKYEKDENSSGLGLCAGHSYSVLGCHELKTKDGQQTRYLLKIRNPHARGEWFGKFGDRDDKTWETMEEDLRRKDSTDSANANIDEGIFWMDLKDVIKYFAAIKCCVVGPEPEWPPAGCKELADGMKSCSINTEWPVELQSKQIGLSSGNIKHFCGYKFEVKRELENITLPAGNDGKCLVKFMILVGGWGAELSLLPQFTYFLYKVQEEDLKNIGKIYRTKQPNHFSPNCSKDFELRVEKYLEPGIWVLVPFLNTAPDAEHSIPKAYIGKGFPFKIRLFTENQTEIVAIPAP